MRDCGIENVLALRGDPPQGQDEWTATEGGLSYSTELAGLISQNYDFTIGAACFPEVHIASPNMEQDLDVLKKKVEAGVTFVITQLFFDNELYFDFVDRARAPGSRSRSSPGSCRSPATADPAHHRRCAARASRHWRAARAGTSARTTRRRSPTSA